MIKEKPILFQPEMVAAILAGRKTQTRRVLKDTTEHKGPYNPAYLECHRRAPGWAEICPHGAVGGELWVRETFYAWGRWEKRWNQKKGRDEWHFIDETLAAGKGYHYYETPPPDYARAAKKNRADSTSAWWRRPSIFMPRAACRINLKIKAIRIEPLHEITDSDALKEGVQLPVNAENGNPLIPLTGAYVPKGWNPREFFALLWHEINGAESWNSNPWVWVIDFERVLYG